MGSAGALTRARRVVARIAHAAPTAISTSPTLKTFARGHDAGTAKTSPRNHRRAFATYAEFVKTSLGGVTPAVLRAPRVAGITPEFAPIGVLRIAYALTTLATLAMVLGAGHKWGL